MGTEFTPIFLFILVAIGTAVGMLTASAILGPQKRTRVKQMPYESGMDPIGDAKQRFDVRYYLVAIVFLALRRGTFVPLPLGCWPSYERQDGLESALEFERQGRRRVRPWPTSEFRPSSVASSSARSWSFSSLCWWRPSPTPGARESSNGVECSNDCPGQVPGQQTRPWHGFWAPLCRADPESPRKYRLSPSWKIVIDCRRELVPQEQPLAHAVCHRVLRHRADGRRCQPV